MCIFYIFNIFYMYKVLRMGYMLVYRSQRKCQGHARIGAARIDPRPALPCPVLSCLRLTNRDLSESAEAGPALNPSIATSLPARRENLRESLSHRRRRPPTWFARRVRDSRRRKSLRRKCAQVTQILQNFAPLSGVSGIGGRAVREFRVQARKTPNRPE